MTAYRSDAIKAYNTYPLEDSEQGLIRMYDTFGVVDEDARPQILWLACRTGKQRAVFHMMSSCKALANTHINGRSMLFNALSMTQVKGLSAKKTWNEAVECAQILIDSGSDVNAFVKKRNNILGYFVKALESKESQCAQNEAYIMNMKCRNRCNKVINIYKMTIVFLLTKNATCYIHGKGDLANLEISHQTDRQISYCFAILNEAYASLPVEYAINKFWSQIRLVVLAHQSKGSTFSSLPYDLVKLIISKMPCHLTMFR